MISDQQRRLVVEALLNAASSVNAGAPPGDALRALLARVRRVADGESETVPTMPPQAPGTSMVHVPKADEQVPKDMQLIKRIFDHWVRESGKTGSKLTTDRVAKIRTRLREGYTEQDLLRAISGCCSSPFHRGENEQGTTYTELVMILRRGSDVERFRDMASTAFVAPTPPEASPEDAAFEAKLRILNEDKKRALRENRREDYDDIVRSISEHKSRRR